MTKKIFHLTQKKTGQHNYYTTLVALVRENPNLGISKFTLDRFDFSKPFENENYIILKSILIR